MKREAEEDWGRGKGNSGIDSDTRNEARQIAVVVAAPVQLPAALTTVASSQQTTNNRQ